MPINQEQGTNILQWVHAFLRDRVAQRFSTGTIQFYTKKLRYLTQYMEGERIYQIDQVTPDQLRQYLIYLDKNHNPGGTHACFRAMRAFFHWYEIETDIDPRSNPIHKIKAPKNLLIVLDALDSISLIAMLNTCERKEEYGCRDYAMLLALLDTGCRATEFLDLMLMDVDLIYGMAQIQHGKGDKARPVFFGRRTRQAIRSYLKHRGNNNGPLWCSRYTERITYSGLRGILRRRSRLAKIGMPPLHSFRRAFAMACKRAGIDEVGVEELLGHEWRKGALRQYLKYSIDDLKKLHDQAAPVDNLPLS